MADHISNVLKQRDDDVMHVQKKDTKMITQMKQDRIEQLNCLKEYWSMNMELSFRSQKIGPPRPSVVLEQNDQKTIYTLKTFENCIKVLKHEHGASFQKLEDQTSSMVLEQKVKAVNAIEKIEASFVIKLANCKEESTKQQLMHIREEHKKQVTHVQQYNIERLKDFRLVQDLSVTPGKTITMLKAVATLFKELGDRLEVEDQKLEEELLPYKQLVLLRKEDEMKPAGQISNVLEQSDNDMMHVQEKHTKLITQMKQDVSEQLKCMIEKTIATWDYFEYEIDELACVVEDKCKKLEDQFSSYVLVEGDKAVKDIEEIKESHDKILAYCKEESTRQQLLHILEEHTKLITRMQQDHIEQLKSLRQQTIAMWINFVNKMKVLWSILEDEGMIIEELELLEDDDEGQSLEDDEGQILEDDVLLLPEE